MIQVEWEYFSDNITSSCPVAVLKEKITGRKILYVYETRMYHYPSFVDQYSFLNLKLTPIPYYKEAEIVRQTYSEEELSSQNKLDLWLEAGCKMIEEDFLSQATEIIELLS